MSEEELKAIEFLKENIKGFDDEFLNKTYSDAIERQRTLLNLIEKQHRKIEKAGDYIQREIWLCEHDIEACCDDEQDAKQYYKDRKEIFEEIKNKILEN